MKTTTEEKLEARLEELRPDLDRLRQHIGRHFLGQAAVVDLLLMVILARGHALLEGAPGLGKTTLVKGLADALRLEFSRIQFTPDLMPADILGARILEESADGRPEFHFERGPIFGNLVLADEINRATPRTQSALLEAMAENQVTVHGSCLAMDDPFCVVATQNPIEMEGTYPLPEAQLDRFMCKLELASPDEKELVQILESTTAAPVAEGVAGGMDVAGLRSLREFVREVPASSQMVSLAARVILATDPTSALAPDGIRQHLRFGASPRGGQALLLLSKARAILAGRPWINEEDIREVAAPALRHRLVLSYEGEAAGVSPDDLVSEALRAAERA